MRWRMGETGCRWGARCRRGEHLPYCHLLRSEGAWASRRPSVDGGGEEFVPVGVVGGEPAGGGVHDELLFGVGFFAPGVELERAECAGLRIGVAGRVWD